MYGTGTVPQSGAVRRRPSCSGGHFARARLIGEVEEEGAAAAAAVEEREPAGRQAGLQCVEWYTHTHTLR